MRSSRWRISFAPVDMRAQRHGEAEPGGLGAGIGADELDVIVQRRQGLAEELEIARGARRRNPAASSAARRRSPPADRSASGYSRCWNRYTCGHSRRAGRRAASRKRLPQVFDLPGSHQQSRPQSRIESARLHQEAVVDRHAPALAHGDVMGGIEGDGRHVAETADRLAVIGGAERIAAVLEQIEVLLAAKLRSVGEMPGAAQRVRQRRSARVRGPTASMARAASMLSVPGSQSTKTGTSRFCRIGASVVGNVVAGVMTSSPSFSGSGAVIAHSVETISRLADEPELTSRIAARAEMRLQRLFEHDWRTCRPSAGNRERRWRPTSSPRRRRRDRRS